MLGGGSNTRYGVFGNASLTSATGTHVQRRYPSLLPRKQGQQLPQILGKQRFADASGAILHLLSGDAQHIDLGLDFSCDAALNRSHDASTLLSHCRSVIVIRALAPNGPSIHTLQYGQYAPIEHTAIMPASAQEAFVETGGITLGLSEAG